jgi:hypothetical protein
MAKVLTGQEFCKIAYEAANSIDDVDQYNKFVINLAKLVAEHFGGNIGFNKYVNELNDVIIAISQDGNIPEDGGVYKEFDKDNAL